LSESREEILSRIRERILSYAASRIGKDAAEDLAQEALLVIETRYRAVERLDELLPLAFQILRYKMNDWRRKGSRRGEFTAAPADGLDLASPDEGALDRLEREELRERLGRALSRMEGRCREIFRMKLEGRTFAEIQAVLGAATINTVYTWDFRCRKQLAEWMSER
jgi:RNA polymerase sigma-70 factor (ECF subfamily)